MELTLFSGQRHSKHFFLHIKNFCFSTLQVDVVPNAAPRFGGGAVRLPGCGGGVWGVWGNRPLRLRPCYRYAFRLKENDGKSSPNDLSSAVGERLMPLCMMGAPLKAPIFCSGMIKNQFCINLHSYCPICN